MISIRFATLPVRLVRTYNCCNAHLAKTINGFYSTHRSFDFATINDVRIGRKEKTNSSLWIRRFSSDKNLDTSTIIKGNVVRSPRPMIEKFPKELLHESIWKNVDRWSDKIALICTDTRRSYTYGQLRKLSGRFATSLRKNKLNPGDTIAIVAPNVPEYAIVVMGASEAGLQVTLINPAYTPREMEKQLKDTDVLAIFTVPSKYSDVKTSIQNISKIKLPPIVINDGSGIIPSDSIKFDDLISDGIEELWTNEKPGRNPEDTFLLPFSSGTTGFPKGVELTHRNLVVQLIQIRNKDVYPGTEATKTHQDIVSLVLPTYHLYGLGLILFTYLSIGAKLVCMPQFSTENFLKHLYNDRPTLLYGVPPIIQFLANSDSVKSEHLASVRYTTCAAAPLGIECYEKFRSRANPEIIVTQGYGMTETSPLVSLTYRQLNDLTAVGHLLSNTEARIVGHDEHNAGQNLGPKEVGEIYVRGPQIMKGYYKNPEATANIMDGEWLKTGDLGCYDHEGLFYICGRIKELIKVKGFQVAPNELEELMRGHDDILDVAVIGVEHEKYGEIPKAFVVPKPCANLSEDDVKEFVAKRVAKYKHLGHVVFTDKIPKSPAGKILRREIKKM